MFIFQKDPPYQDIVLRCACKKNVIVKPGFSYIDFIQKLASLPENLITLYPKYWAQLIDIALARKLGLDEASIILELPFAKRFPNIIKEATLMNKAIVDSFFQPISFQRVDEVLKLKSIFASPIFKVIHPEYKIHDYIKHCIEKNSCSYEEAENFLVNMIDVVGNLDEKQSIASSFFQKLAFDKKSDYLFNFLNLCTKFNAEQIAMIERQIIDYLDKIVRRFESVSMETTMYILEKLNKEYKQIKKIIFGSSELKNKLRKEFEQDILSIKELDFIKKIFENVHFEGGLFTDFDFQLYFEHQLKKSNIKTKNF